MIVMKQRTRNKIAEIAKVCEEYNEIIQMHGRILLMDVGKDILDQFSFVRNIRCTVYVPEFHLTKVQFSLTEEFVQSLSETEQKCLLKRDEGFIELDYFHVAKLSDTPHTKELKAFCEAVQNFKSIMLELDRAVDDALMSNFCENFRELTITQSGIKVENY